MAKMLDLSVFQASTMPVKLLNGEVIKLKKPTQKLLMDFVSFQKMNEVPVEEQYEKVINCVVDILNNNTTGKKFKREDLEEYDLEILKAIIEGYVEFLNEVMANPN